MNCTWGMTTEIIFWAIRTYVHTCRHTSHIYSLTHAHAHTYTRIKTNKFSAWIWKIHDWQQWNFCLYKSTNKESRLNLIWKNHYQHHLHIHFQVCIAWSCLINSCKSIGFIFTFLTFLCWISNYFWFQATRINTNSQRNGRLREGKGL